MQQPAGVDADPSIFEVVLCTNAAGEAAEQLLNKLRGWQG